MALQATNHNNCPRGIVVTQTFYAIHEGFYEGVEQRLQLLAQACKSRDVSFIALDSLGCDYTHLPKPGKGDMLYNCARGSQVLESLLLNPEVATFYVRNPEYNLITSTSTWSMLHDKAGLPVPRTIYGISSDREFLKRYVDYLGGFPVVAKLEGGTRGVGAIKIDTWQGLISTMDYLLTTGQRFILREFIDAQYGVRAMVLGDQVIASAKFLFQHGDFRNAPLFGQTRYEPMTLTPEVEALCVKATRIANLEMSGTDLLFDSAGKPFLLEINLPTGFQTFAVEPWLIQDQWVDFLLRKARR